MNTDSNCDRDWQACPQGELLHLQQQLRATRRSPYFFVMAGSIAIGSAMLVGGLVAYGVLGPKSANASERMSCSECIGHFNEYRDHLQKTLPINDAVLVQRIERHLDKCGGCRAKFEKQCRKQTVPGADCTRGMCPGLAKL